jgi:DNA-binding IclR family transcriptional regulator
MKEVLPLNTKSLLVPAVDSAARILKLLSSRKYKKSTLTELSTILEINKSTCLRILRTLKEHEMVSFDDNNKTYSLGIRLVTLGERASEHIDLISFARPILNNLKNETSMYTMLLKPISGYRMLNLCMTAPVNNNLLKLNLNTGDWYPMTAVASGLCHLAYMSDEEIKKVLAKYKNFQSSLYPKLINNEKDFFDTLSKIRNEGICISYEEFSPQPLVTTFSVPVFVGKTLPVLSLTIVGIHSSIDPLNIVYYSNILKKYGQKLSEELSSSPTALIC